LIVSKNIEEFPDQKDAMQGNILRESSNFQKTGLGNVSSKTGCEDFTKI